MLTAERREYSTARRVFGIFPQIAVRNNHMPDQKDTGAQAGAENTEIKTNETAAPAPAPAAKPPEPDFTPPVRRSAKDFIIARKEKQLEKARAATGKDGGDNGNDGGDDTVAKEDKEIIDGRIAEHLQPFEKQLKDNADEQELKDLFVAHPEAKDLEAGIRKYMEHEAYKGVSLEMIYFGLAAKLGKLGPVAAAAKAAADAEAAADVLGGSPRRPQENDGQLPDFSKMSNAEFEKWDKENNRRNG